MYASTINFTETKWVEELEGKIKADIEKGKVPVAVFINAGGILFFLSNRRPMFI